MKHLKKSERICGSFVFIFLFCALTGLGAQSLTLDSEFQALVIADFRELNFQSIPSEELPYDMESTEEDLEILSLCGFVDLPPAFLNSFFPWWASDRDFLLSLKGEWMKSSLLSRKVTSPQSVDLFDGETGSFLDSGVYTTVRSSIAVPVSTEDYGEGRWFELCVEESVLSDIDAAVLRWSLSPDERAELQFPVSEILVVVDLSSQMSLDSDQSAYVPRGVGYDFVDDGVHIGSAYDSSDQILYYPMDFHTHSQQASPESFVEPEIEFFENELNPIAIPVHSNDQTSRRAMAPASAGMASSCSGRVSARTSTTFWILFVAGMAFALRMRKPSQKDL